MTWNARLPFFWIAITFSLLILSLGFFFPDRLLQLHTHWTTADDLDLGYFLLIIFLYFTYTNTGQALGKPNYYFLPLVVVISCAFFIAQALDLKTLFFVSLALALPVFIVTSLGLKTAKEALIPWAILMMAMPFWYLAIAVLQGITVKVVSELASLISLTVLVEGNYFTISTGVVHVAGGCSGLKYFMTSITLALISSAMNKRTFKLTFLSILIAALLAMLGNWIRVFILLLVAYYEGIEHPLMADHDTLGWIVFAIVMIPWFIIDRRMDADQAETSDSTEPAPTSNSTPAETQKQIIIALGLSFGLFFLTQFLIKPAEVKSEIDYQLTLPAQLNDLKLSELKHRDWQPDYPKAHTQRSGTYLFGRTSYDAHVLSYLFGTKEEMANKTNHIFNEEHWFVVSDQAWQSEQDPNMKIRIALAKSGNQYRRAYYWYKHGDNYANSILGSKFAQLKGLYNGIDSAQLISLSTICDQSCQQDALPNQEIEDMISKLHQQTGLVATP